MRAAVLFAFFTLTSAAYAQQAPQVDPALRACQQLLGRANAEVIHFSAQSESLAKQLEEKKKDEPKP
jgi:hypothetical protein